MQEAQLSNQTNGDSCTPIDVSRFYLNDFEGPLDLLLFLIKKNDINIYDIPIAEITKQYLQWLTYAEGKNLDNLTEFYLMASTLLYIKSKMLLPVEVNLDDEIEDPRKELVEKLIEYQRIKKLTDLIEEREKGSEWVIERIKKQRKLPFEETDDMWQQLDVWDLVCSFQKLINSFSAGAIYDMYEEVSINEKITLIDELLEKKEVISFSDLILSKSSLMEIICAFLAILDSVKLKKISIYQNRFFGDIQIRRGAYLSDEDHLEEDYAEVEAVTESE